MKISRAWWLDLKLGWRMLLKYPGLALAGGFGIAVGVAISAGGFSVIYGNYRASAVPLPESNRLVSVELWDAAGHRQETRLLAEARTWREQLKSVAEWGAFRTVNMNLLQPGATPENVRVAAMTASGFRLARVRPLLGRYLTDDDERENAPPVVVIGERIWRQRFGANPAIVGRTLRLGDQAYAIAGVMPEHFAFPVNHRYWVPLRAAPAPAPLTGPAGVMVFGRLAPGATLDGAQAELKALVSQQAQTTPQLYAHLQPRVLPYPLPHLGLHETADLAGVYALQCLMISLLVLVCLNVAILVYSRTATRQVEMAVRTALGASRGRIVAQLLMEAVVLAGIAAAAGVLIAGLSLRQLGEATRHLQEDLPFWVSFRLLPESAWFAAGLGVLAAALVGAIPAWQATRRDVQQGLRAVSSGAGLQLGKVWTALIVGQVGVVVAFLPTAVSMTSQDIRDGLIGPGFAAREYLSAELGLAETNDARLGQRQAELMRRLATEPRVAGVTYALAIPGAEQQTRIEIEETAAARLHEVRFNRVDHRFLDSFQVPLLAGRGLREAEKGVAVVNQSLARELFGGQALGRRIRHAANRPHEPPGPWLEVVGIVSDFPPGVSPGMNDSPLIFYQPAAPAELTPATLLVHLRDGDPLSFESRLRELAADVDPALYVRHTVNLEDDLRREQWVRRLQAGVVGCLTASVLVLSAAGIYALMSLTVTRRRREIGIRVALGADPRQILTGVFARACGQLAVGAGLGALVALWLESQLGLMSRNPGVVVPAVALLMMAVGLSAAWGPARRSLRLQPTEALREQ